MDEYDWELTARLRRMHLPEEGACIAAAAPPLELDGADGVDAELTTGGAADEGTGRGEGEAIAPEDEPYSSVGGAAATFPAAGTGEEAEGKVEAVLEGTLLLDGVGATLLESELPESPKVARGPPGKV
jgi:hypothetical protein